MNKHQFIIAQKGKMVPTETAASVLRARLSLRETQVEFAKRFLVTPVTIHNWETGKVSRMQNIHKKVLEELIKNLKKEGYYLPDEVFTTVFRSELAKHGNAIDV